MGGLYSADIDVFAVVKNINGNTINKSKVANQGGSRMKQYCSNCIHCYWTDDSSYGGDFCCRLLLNKGSNFLETFWIHSKCEERNVGNSCLGYKKKWYKFWIRRMGDEERRYYCSM